MTEEYHRLPVRVLVIGLLMAFGIWLPLLAVPPIEDVIETGLGISHALTALPYSAPVATLSLVAISGGFLADRIGIKKAVGAGAIVLCIGALVRGLSTSFSSLRASTFAYGIGLGLCIPNLPKPARHCSPRDRSNVTLGIFSVAIIASGALSLALTR